MTISGDYAVAHCYGGKQRVSLIYSRTPHNPYPSAPLGRRLALWVLRVYGFGGSSSGRFLDLVDPTAMRCKGI
jgi:hypothetical protein